MITTERLVLRRFVPEDAEALFGILSDPRVVAYEPYGVLTLQECAAEAARRAGSAVFWAVCRAEDGRLLGNVTLTPEQWDGWELGYVFGAQHWGRGYATEAARALVDHAFAARGAHRVSAQCNPLNAPSWRLLQRLGMRREGHLLKNCWFKAGPGGRPLWQDTLIYALLRDEWAAGGAGG